MSDDRKRILWVDDEIEMLRSHALYLDSRGYEIISAANGPDALELLRQRPFDAALIDEMMPVMNGLEVLRRMKEMRPEMPVIMVTKNEAEELMDQAIGREIQGFLTKPVNPSQILSVLKGILSRRQISQIEFTRRWAEESAELSRILAGELDAAGWMNLHVRISTLELQLDRRADPELANMLMDIRAEANQAYARWLVPHYPAWLQGELDARPTLSMDVIPRALVPLLEDGKPTLLLVMDCLRFDQWLMLEPMLAEKFEIRRAGHYAILPTATPYARNAIFSGRTPLELADVIPEIWTVSDEDEASTNRFERQLLSDQLGRLGISLKPEPRYVKVLDSEEAADFERRINEHLNAPLTTLVYNFLDILVHTRQSVEVLKEMIPDEAAYRSVIGAWFQHSSLYRIMQAYGRAGGRVLVTSDHGAIRVRRGSKVIGDRETSAAIRYKYGKNLKCDSKQAVHIKNPREWMLPQRGVNSEFIFATQDYYFVYPTNYHHYLEQYRESFQHGGISMEEMILPMVSLIGKG